MSDSRRDFLRGWFGKKPEPAPTPPPPIVNLMDPAIAAAATPPPPPTFGRGKPLPILRPPGAIEERAFLTACTRCGDCIKSCPHEAIFLAPPRFRHAAGSPMLDPARAPCQMCEGLPCVAACQPKALRADLPVRMGTVFLKQTCCLAYHGTTCSACVERCPVPGAVRLENGRPVIDAATCTGCGVCQYVCPAPQNPILILPVLERPAPPTPPAPRAETVP